MKKKWIAAVVLSVFIVTIGAGCAKQQDAQVYAIKQESLENEDRKTQENSALQGNEATDAKAQSDGIEPTTGANSKTTEILDGNVRGIGDNGIVIIKTRLEETDEDGVALAVAPAPGAETEEDYVGVNFTDQTKMELHIVKNNGVNPEEDITVQQASLSDIKDDMSVTLEGYYDEEVFVAEKVILYEFV